VKPLNLNLIMAFDCQFCVKVSFPRPHARISALVACAGDAGWFMGYTLLLHKIWVLLERKFSLSCFIKMLLSSNFVSSLSTTLFRSKAYVNFCYYRCRPKTADNRPKFYSCRWGHRHFTLQN
jgi:hypothetical protein